jgi:hypothetical protein
MTAKKNGLIFWPKYCPWPLFDDFGFFSPAFFPMSAQPAVTFALIYF